METEDQMNGACWSYLHGQMDAEMRLAFEQRLASEPELIKTLRRIQAVHALVEEAEREKELDSLMEEFDLEEGSSGKVLSFSKRWTQAGLALAACLALFLVYLPTTRSGVTWNDPQVGNIEFRGGDEASAAFSRSELEAVHAALQALITSQLSGAQEAGDLRQISKARISSSYSPSPTGALMLELIVLEKGEPLYHGEWAFNSLSDFEAGLPTLADEVLAGLKGE